MCDAYESQFNEDEEYDRFDDERAEMEDAARCATCHCGAYQWSEKRGEYIQVADCVC